MTGWRIGAITGPEEIVQRMALLLETITSCVSPFVQLAAIEAMTGSQKYVDTMILYAKKKDPIFLQKFHHVGATICWHLGYVYEFEGIYFASLVNSGVHTIMYGYYFLSLFKWTRPYIHRYKVYITSMQVGQLVFGFVALPWFYYYKESVTNQRVLIIFDIYIGCLIVLFLQFMIRNYIKN
jgi:hypothetical protein